MSFFTHQNKSPGQAVCMQFAIVLLLLGFLSACEDEVNPFIGTELPYTVWGTINPIADTQAVRVFLIDDILRLVSSDPLDANVSIIEVQNNTRYVLEDSVIQLFNGDYRHIYWGEFDVEHLQTYRLEVERSDGQLTKSSEIQVPGPISVQSFPANDNAITDLIQPLFIEGNPPATPRIDVVYNAYTTNQDGIRLQDNSVTISYATKTKMVRDTLRLDLDLRADFRTIRADFNDKDLVGAICLQDVDIAIHVGNKEWQSPTGVFDPNFLVEPGTLTNCENGFGFFGAGFVESINVQPSGLLAVRAGFFDCGGEG